MYLFFGKEQIHISLPTSTLKGRNCQFLWIPIQSLIFSSTGQCILVFTFKYWCNGTNVLLIFIISMSQYMRYDWSIWQDIFTVQPAKFKSLFWSTGCNLEIWWILYCLYCKLRNLVFFHSDLWPMCFMLGPYIRVEKAWSVSYSRNLEPD